MPFTISSEHRVSQNPTSTPKGPLTATETAKQARDAKRTFEVNKFRYGVNAGEARGRKEIVITQETENSYTSFMRDYLATIGRDLENNPDFRENKYAQIGIMFYDALTTNGKPDAKKIEELFNKEESWGTITLLMEEYASQMNRAQGFTSGIVPDNQISSTVGERAVGAESGEEHEGFWRSLGNAGAAMRSMLSGEPEMCLAADTDMFRAIKGNKEEKEYFQAITGLDLDNLDVYTSGRLRKVSGRVLNTNRFAKDAQNEALKALGARRDFLKNIGVVAKRLDTLPEEPILRNTVVEKGFGQDDTLWVREVIRIFSPNSGGIKDLSGNNPGDPTFCRPSPAGRFDWNLLNRVENVQRFNRARREILAKMATDLLKDALNQEGAHIKTDVDKRKDSTVDSARKQEAKTKQDALNNNKEEAEGKKDSFKTIGEKEAEIKKLEKQLDEDYKLPTFGVGFVGAIEKEVDTLNNELNGVAGASGLKAQLQATRSNWQGEFDTQYTATIASWRKGMGAADKLDNELLKQSATVAADTKHGDELRRLENEVREKSKKVTDLNSLRDQYQKATKGLAEAEVEVVRNIPKDLTETSQAYEELVNNPGPPPSTITDVDLDKKTVDQLIKKATKPPYKKKNKTPTEQEELRKLIIRAKTERRARLVEEYNPSGTTAEVKSFDDVINGGVVSANALLSMPDKQLLHILDTDPAYATLRAVGKLTRDILDEAKKVAQRKLSLRYRFSMEEQVKDFDDQVKVQQEIIDKEDEKEKKAKEKAKGTSDIMGRQGEIFHQSLKIKDETDRFASVAKLTNADTTYSQAERQKGLSKGYYEMMNMLFSYQSEQGLERTKRFEELYAFMPPKELARRLNESLGLGVSGVGATEIDIVLTRLRDRVRGMPGVDKISYPELYSSFRKLINQLGKEAAVA